MNNSKKATIVNQANAELVRIGAKGFDFGLNVHGVISGSDESGYYPVINYKTLVADLKEFADNSITDQLYDGDDRYTWSQIWGTCGVC